MKRKVVITNNNDGKKYEMTDELPNNVRLEKNLKTPWNYSLVPVSFSK